MTEKEYWFWLSNINGIGAKRIEKLLDYFNTPKEIFHGNEKHYEKIEGMTVPLIQEIMGSKNIEEIRKNYDKLMKLGIYLVTKEDVNYPERLKNIYNPPAVLYVRGELPEPSKVSIAIIGARNCSSYGREMAIRFAKDLTKAGMIVISGLARGIDSYAHFGALEAGGKTYGILGSGINVCYPRENIALYERMQGQGGIISEFGLDCAPLPANFPMRNRIISGLSDGILVVEAKERSGSLITADLGLDQGKNIYVLPGRAYDELSKGCNNLIKMGGKLVINFTDIAEDYNLIYNDKLCETKKNNKLLETMEKIVYANLSLEPKHLEQILQETELSVAALTEILLALEIKGFIRQINKNYYIAVIE